jgi:hypothetical protein
MIDSSVISAIPFGLRMSRWSTARMRLFSTSINADSRFVAFLVTKLCYALDGSRKAAAAGWPVSTCAAVSALLIGAAVLATSLGGAALLLRAASMGGPPAALYSKHHASDVCW